jgi:hypothetical protein
MQTKIVYVLVSSPEDIYYEQCLVSVYSLRKYHKDAEVVVLVDDATAASLTGNRSLLVTLATEIKVIDTPIEYTSLQRSRVIKTSIRKHVSGDFMFIDTDTVICDPLDDIDNIEAELAIVPDFHVSFDEYPFRGYMLSEMYRLFGQDVSHVVDYFNSGVIYAKDTEVVHRFFEQWNKNWTYSAIEKNNPKDQPALLKTDADAGQVIRVLDGEYNCQIAASIRYLYSAKILHFFNARFFAHNNIHPFYSSDFYLRVRNEGFTREIDEMINNVRMLFDEYSTPISRPEFEYLSSPEGHIMMALREKCGWKWSVMSIILKIFRKLS